MLTFLQQKCKWRTTGSCCATDRVLLLDFSYSTPFAYQDALSFSRLFCDRSSHRGGGSFPFSVSVVQRLCFWEGMRQLARSWVCWCSPCSVSLHGREILRDSPGVVGVVEPCRNQCLCLCEQGSKWLVEPRFQVAVCRWARWSCIFNTVGYKWPIFTSAYIIYSIPSLPSSLSDVLCIDLSFTLQLHFALLHFNDIWSSFIHIWVHWYKWKKRNNQHTWFIWWHKNVIS